MGNAEELPPFVQVKDGEGDHPKVGYSSPLLTLWEKPSTRFETPKAILYLQFACPEVKTTFCKCLPVSVE